MATIQGLFNPISLNHLKAFDYAVNSEDGQMPQWFNEGFDVQYPLGWQSEIIGRLAKVYVELALHDRVSGLTQDGMKVDLFGQDREDSERRKIDEKIAGVHR